MRRKTIVIMDSDQTYAAALMNCLNRREDIRADVCAFSDIQSLKGFFKDHDAGILMISEDDLPDPNVALTWPADLVVVLTAKATDNSEEENARAVHERTKDDQPAADRQYKDRRMVRLSKYQPVSRLMALVDEAEKEIGIRQREREGLAEVIGIFSPVRRCGKTSLALALAYHLTDSGRRVLFVSFESFLPMNWLKKVGEGVPTGAECTLEEALYLVKSRDDGAEKVLRESEAGSMNCLVPPTDVRDFGQVEPVEWKHLIGVFRKCARIDAIVIDFDELPGFYPDVLTLCDDIYLPCLPDTVSEEKASLFLNFLSETEAELMIRKIMIRAPEASGVWHEPEEMKQEQICQYRENLRSGEIGQLAARLIEEDRL